MRRALSSWSGWSGSNFLHAEGSLRFEGTLETTIEPKSKVLVTIRTSVSFKGTQIWFMRCNGYCKKRDLSCLRHVLLDAYRKGEFVGGRGETDHEHGFWAYRNRLSSGRFEEFCGSEHVHRIPQKGRAIYPVTSLLTYRGGLNK